MQEHRYDLVVLGGGPGGYVAAIRAAQLGMNVACVDDRPRLGGTCLNIGCIPSKALLNSTEKFWEARNHFTSFGIVVEQLRLDLKAMMNQKEQAVRTLTDGINYLFRKHKIKHLRGKGRLRGHSTMEVAIPNEEPITVNADHFILATGSVPVQVPGVKVDHERVLTSEGLLSLPTVPEHLIIIGGGYIGLEMGSVWGRLGAKVTCVEMMDRLIPTMDAELARQLQKVLEKQGFDFRLKQKVTDVHVKDGSVNITMASSEGGEGAEKNDQEQLSGSHLLVAVGRRPLTDQLGLEKAGVELTEHGFIAIDEHFRTTAEGIFAIGDVAREPMLAHKAQDEGIACVEKIAGRQAHVNYGAIPAVIYTSPEVASVGHTEEELQKANRKYRVGRFPYRANSRARCVNQQEGFVKILADEENDLVLGGHILGPDAGTTIHELVTTMEFGASAEELGRTSHGHPTFNEAVREAALAVHRRSLHV
jgi:dihydrolipoamide dehydrogenase